MVAGSVHHFAQVNIALTREPLGAIGDEPEPCPTG
jgi:hypothetical protein